MKLATLLRRAALRIKDVDISYGKYWGMCYALHNISVFDRPNICTNGNSDTEYWYAYTFMQNWVWPTLAQHGFKKLPVNDYWWPCTEKFVQTRLDALNLLADYAEYLDL